MSSATLGSSDCPTTPRMSYARKMPLSMSTCGVFDSSFTTTFTGAGVSAGAVVATTSASVGLSSTAPSPGFMRHSSTNTTARPANTSAAIAAIVPCMPIAAAGGASVPATRRRPLVPMGRARRSAASAYAASPRVHTVTLPWRRPR